MLCCSSHTGVPDVRMQTDLTHLCSYYLADLCLLWHTCLLGIMMQKDLAHLCICYCGVDRFALLQGQTHLCTWCHDADLTHLCSCYVYADMFALFQGQTHLCPRCYDADLTHLCSCYYCAEVYCFVWGEDTPVHLLLSCRGMFALLLGQTRLCTRCHDADRKI